MADLTITISNIPEDFLNSFWEYAKKEAKKDIGLEFQKTNHIEINHNVITDYGLETTDILAEVFGGIMTCHVAMAAHKQLNG